MTIDRYRIMGAVAALMLAALVWAPPAQAALTCTYNSETRTATIVNTNRDYVDLGVNSEDVITASDITCEGATTETTDTVVFRDESEFNMTLAMSPDDDRFGSGFTNEPGSSDELEFELELSSRDLIQYITEQAPDIRVGSDPDTKATRLNLNADEADGVDADVFVNVHLRKIYLSSNGQGASRLDASGGAGTGAHYAGGVTFVASSAADTLVGGLKHDYFRAAQGDDDIAASEGYDEIFAGLGDDDVNAGSGSDKLHGEDGMDDMHGGPGSDRIRGQKDNDTLFGDEGVDWIRGGAGHDDCFGGGDGDTIEACEN